MEPVERWLVILAFIYAAVVLHIMLFYLKEILRILRAAHADIAQLKPADGDVVVYFTKSNVVHLGDDLFAGRFPYIDLEGGGSVKGLIRNLEKVLSEIPADARIIPGHGPLSRPAGLRTYVTMLKETAASVERAMAEGKTADQIKSEKILSEYDSYSWQFISTDRYIDILYTDLSKK